MQLTEMHVVRRVKKDDPSNGLTLLSPVSCPCSYYFKSLPVLCRILESTEYQVSKNKHPPLQYDFLSSVTC